MAPVPGKISSAPDSVGAPPVQLPADDQRLFTAPVQVCTAGACRSSSASSRGRKATLCRAMGERFLCHEVTVMRCSPCQACKGKQHTWLGAQTERRGEVGPVG